MPSNTDDLARKPEKLTLVSLFGLTGILVIFVLGLLYVVPLYGLGRINSRLPLIMGIITILMACAVVVCLGMLGVVTLLGRDVPFSPKLRSVAAKALLPVLVGVGRLVGLKKEDVQHAFVAVNNEIVMAQCRNGRPPRRILLLMPHCLQNSECKVKITFTVENCKRCGKCPIKDLLDLTSRYGVELAVATGGTVARRIVLDKRPDLIIAVACERDLTSGIQDTTPLPVYGIFNERPFGPCMNTRVSIERVEAVLREVVAKRKET
jgi:hypothetical protein